MQEKFKEAFKSFSTVPNIEDIKAFFKKKRKHLEDALKDLEIRESLTLKMAEQFWQLFKDRQCQLLGRSLKKSKARPRKKESSKRSRVLCPFEGCIGKAINT
ncbi:hypothetical protein E2C01_068107 [Portunus trituberculatus]|uniref:Uncharacterized protein n=1 Tax=Portunus trituberculatus TaxID=210409 RepID=A0A5B7HN09_PORTR|nr:hypothetical protein [Portunus trituberculatus]